MVVTFPCKICNKTVTNNHHAVQRDKCHLWVHIKCNRIILQTYKYLQKRLYVWHCLKVLRRLQLFLMKSFIEQTKDAK